MRDSAPFFTSLEEAVYGLRLPQEIAAALFSRYSRSAKGLREIFADEFLGEEDIAGLLSGQGPVTDTRALQKARAFFDRVLVGYGDDSVAQLGGAHIACEQVSNIAALLLTDARIGMAPLEKSTRYVRFDTKRTDGTWPYYRLSCADDKYNSAMDSLFETYARLMKPVQEWVRGNMPKEKFAQSTDEQGQQRAYERAVKAKACDVLRGLLPASTLTNVGLYGSGQAFEYLLAKLWAEQEAETDSIGDQMLIALQQLIPSFVKRAGQQNSYYAAHAARMADILQTLKLTMFAPTESGVRLFRPPVAQDKTKERVVAAMLYPQARLPMSELLSLEFLQPHKLDEVIAVYVGAREHRRQKPGRALEHAEYLFEVCANLGCYRDLHRHRLLTQQRQLLTVRHGYDVPAEIEAAGYKAAFVDALEPAVECFLSLEQKYPYRAQYAVPFAFRVRWTMQLNLREAVHVCELRTMPQGHQDYRILAQSMARQIIDLHPWTEPCFKFVDWETYDLGRLGSEVRTDIKRGG
jgi:thymidylate synthase ThyX